MHKCFEALKEQFNGKEACCISVNCQHFSSEFEKEAFRRLGLQRPSQHHGVSECKHRPKQPPSWRCTRRFLSCPADPEAWTPDPEPPNELPPNCRRDSEPLRQMSSASATVRLGNTGGGVNNSTERSSDEAEVISMPQRRTPNRDNLTKYPSFFF